MIPYCKAHGIGLIPWGPLHSGDLAKPLNDEGTLSARKKATKGTPFERKLSAADVETIKRVHEVAEKKGWKAAQVALTWISGKVASPIVGINSVSTCTAD